MPLIFYKYTQNLLLEKLRIFINEIIWSEETYNIYEISKNAKGVELFNSYKASFKNDEFAINQKLVAECIQNKTPFESERFVYFDNGARRKYLLGKGEPICNEKGKVVALRGTIQDITDRKNLELENEKTKNRLLEAQKISKLGSWEFDVNTYDTIWSPVLVDIFEIEETENPNNYYNRYRETFDEVDLANFDTQLNLCLTEGIPYKVEHKSYFDNKTRFKYIVTNGFLVYDEFGKPKYLYGTTQDITEQKLLELDILKKQEQLNEAQAIAQIGSFDFNLQTQELYWSHELHNIFEISLDTPKEKIYELYLSRFKAEDIERLNDLIANAIAFKSDYEIEHPIFIGDTTKYIYGKAKIICDVNGNPTNIRGIAQDITERKQTDEQLKLAKDNLNTTFEAITEGIVLQDLEGTIIECNPAAEQILGLTREQMEGKKSIDPDWRAIHEDGADYPGNTHPAMRTLATGESIFNDIMGVHKPNGELTWININSVLLPNNRGVVCSFADITEAKKNEKTIVTREKWIRSLVSNMDDLVFVLDTNFIFKEYFTKDADSLYTKPEDFIGKHIDNSGLPADALYIIKNALQNCIDTKTSQKVEYSLNFGSQIIWFDLGVSFVLDNNDTISDIICVARNITDAKKIERDIIHAKNAAEAASVAKSEFLANMSHEIRTPLNGVIGFSDLLKNTQLDENQNIYVNNINSSAKSLLDIINDILDFSKIEAGKLELDYHEFSLVNVCFAAANIMSYQCENKGIDLLVNYPSTVPNIVWGDAVRIRQILVNLMSNAVKFTEKGEVELKVELLKSSKYSSLLRIGVRDTGVGISSDKLTKIFDAFSQEDSTITRKFGGTGLGLSISNKLLSLMNSSQLMVKSELGVGSEFYFEIEIKAESRRETLKSLEDKKLALILSSAKESEILKEIILRKNVQVNVFDSGASFLETVSKNEFYDFVVIDQNLKDKEGIEIVKEIRTFENNTNFNSIIILLRGVKEDLKLQSLCFEYKVDFQIAKPVLPHSLLKCLILDGFSDTNNEVNKVNVVGRFINTTKKVLVVDDNKINILLAKTVLKKIIENAEIIEAYNGEEAVSLFESHQPDIIFMDIQMPIMNGYEASQAIRKLEFGKNVPIVALTAGIVTGERERCLNAGMNDYLSKPFVKEQLEKVVNNYLLV